MVRANIAETASVIAATVVYTSSCGLFGDEIRTYTERDPVVLKTQYAKSKYLGEKKIRELCDKFFIIRPGWLFGGSSKHQKNFVYRRCFEALDTAVISSASDKFGCPTYTLHLAKGIMDLLETRNYELYHITKPGSTS